jgi:hypothetical protein
MGDDDTGSPVADDGNRDHHDDWITRYVLSSTNARGNSKAPLSAALFRWKIQTALKSNFLRVQSGRPCQE